MKNLEEYLMDIKEAEHQTKLSELIARVMNTFPQLTLKIAWNQPMFCDHDTYIIGFSYASKHIAIAPEKKVLEVFVKQLEATGYACGKHIFRIEWEKDVNYDLLTEIIHYSIDIKKDCTTFWLKD